MHAHGFFARVAARRLLPCLATLLLLSGCALLHLREETTTLYNSTIIVGLVSDDDAAAASPLVIVAREVTGDRHPIAHHTVLHEPGPYELMVGKGQWQVLAFADANGDLAWQPGERIGQHAGGPIRVEQSGGVVQEVHVAIRASQPPNIDFPAGVPVSPNALARLHRTSSGVVRALDDPLFNEDNGVRGFWRPLEFFREYGGTISFLHPFDPDKIPILFVHGATGTPAGWQYLVDRLDLNRYQPWFYFYPSGASIKSMADLLFWKLINLKNRYPTKEMHLVAHSMGGLVARSFLVDYGQLFPAIRAFVSLSTPWSGDELVENGLKYSPGVIPVWRDMDPNGEFAQSIYRKALPPGVSHYLLFGHRGNRNPLRPNNDGVVTLATQLDPRAQTEARMVIGFEEDHGSILESERVAATLTRILSQTETARPRAAKEGTGLLMMRFSSATPTSGDLWPDIQITPKDRDQADSYFQRLPLSQGDQPLGPFPVGEYEVRVLANGFRTNPASQTVRISPGQRAELKVDLIPSGTIAGLVQHRFYQEADPAGVYLPLRRTVRLRSLHLSGPGVERSLTPEEAETFDIFPCYQAGRDWAHGNGFAFYDLPQGEYTLTIEAEGQPPYSEQRRVDPGLPAPLLSIILP